MIGGVSRGRGDLWFWLLVLGGQLLIMLVAFKSPLLAVALAGAVGLLALLALVIGTRGGTLLITGFVVAVTVCLPGDIALEYRLAIGGGGVYIVDFFLALLLVSLALYALTHPGLRPCESPVRLPFFLFLLWVVAAALIGFLRGNELKLILQDARVLAYYVLFFVVILVVNDRRSVLVLLRLLALCVPVVFAIGVVYAALGQGMALEYVEPGVSRFPAPDDVFLMSSVMMIAFFTVWPPGRSKPRWLWGLLLLSLLGLVISLVRGDWLAFAVAVAYLLVVARVRERMRLVALGVVLAVLLAGALAVAQPALLRSVVSRAMAVTAVHDRNVQWRLIENRAVGAQIEQSPWVGNGLGKDYLFDWSRYGVAPYRKSYIHNAYYWFVQRMGVVGMALFTWLAIAYLLPWMKARAALPRDDPWLLGLVYGGRALLVALLVVSITSPRIAEKLAVTVLGLVMGLSEVALALLKQRAPAEETESESQAAGAAAERASG